MVDDQIQIFLSYARDDDEVTPGLRQAKGFVTALHEQLDHIFKDEGYPRPRIWRDKQQIERAEQFDPKIRDAIKGSSLFLVVLSRNWINRPYCLEELKLFGQRWGDVRERIIVVRKNEVEEADHPELLKGTQGYQFFEYEGSAATGKERPYFVRGQVQNELYHELVAELGGYLWKAAKRCREREKTAPAPQPVLPPTGRTVYLAKPADDMRDAYLRVSNELVARGFNVVPPLNQEIPFDSSASKFIDGAMAVAETSIHLLGDDEGFAPAKHAHIVNLQLARAAARISDAVLAGNETGSGNESAAKFSRIIWAPKIVPGASGLIGENLRDPLAVLSGFDKYVSGDQVVSDVLNGFVGSLMSMLERAQPVKDKKSWLDGEIKPDSKIYIYHQKEDRGFARGLAKLLREQKAETFFPAMEGDHVEREMLHRRYLIDCDSVVLCWAQATDAWAKNSANELKNWRALGRQSKFACRGLVLGPPPGETKSDVDLPPPSEIDYVLDLTIDVQPKIETLRPFFSSVQPSHP